MILLSGQSLTPAEWFRPEGMGLNLEERKSTASLTLGPENPEATVGAWMLDDEEPGSGIVWRVKSADTQYDREMRTAQLEHIINTLRDVSLFGEVTPAMISGVSGATTCTAREAALYILGKQSHWVLGDFEYSQSAPYSFNGETLYAALETVTGSLADAVWEFNMAVYPFVLHVRQASETVACEMRGGRNIQTLRRTVDRSRMYTRIYPIGKDNLHITGDYISRNEAAYGRVDRVETNQNLDTEEKLRAWGTERLGRHCEPAVNVMISGLDMSRETGEALDRLTIGRKCRVPLPEYGTTITETVKKLSWRDKIRDPKNVTVTLANVLEDVASIIRRQAASAAADSRGGAQRSAQDHAWFEDTDDHVAMIAEAVAGEGAAEDWSRVAEIVVDGDGIHQRVTEAIGDLVTAQAAIEVASSSISQVVRAIGNNGEVSIASIVTKINNSTGQGEVHIDAGHVYINAGAAAESNIVTTIGGKLDASAVTASFIAGKIAEIQNMQGISASFSGSIRVASGLYLGADPTDVSKNLMKAVIGVSVDNGVLTLTQANGDTTNFSKTTLVSGSWSGGTYSAAADPNGLAQAQTTVALYSAPSSPVNNVVAIQARADGASGSLVAAKAITLTENVSSKQVALTVSGVSGNQAVVSTEATYNKGMADYYSNSVGAQWDANLSWNPTTSKWRVKIPNVTNTAQEDWNITIPFRAFYYNGAQVDLWYVDSLGVARIAVGSGVQWYY